MKWEKPNLIDFANPRNPIIAVGQCEAGSGNVDACNNGFANTGPSGCTDGNLADTDACNNGGNPSF